MLRGARGKKRAAVFYRSVRFADRSVGLLRVDGVPLRKGRQQRLAGRGRLCARDEQARVGRSIMLRRGLPVRLAAHQLRKENRKHVRVRKNLVALLGGFFFESL